MLVHLVCMIGSVTYVHVVLRHTTMGGITNWLYNYIIDWAREYEQIIPSEKGENIIDRGIQTMTGVYHFHRTDLIPSSKTNSTIGRFSATIGEKTRKNNEIQVNRPPRIVTLHYIPPSQLVIQHRKVNCQLDISSKRWSIGGHAITIDQSTTTVVMSWPPIPWWWIATLQGIHWISL